VVALIGAVDPADAVQHVHAAVAAAPVASQLLTDAGLVDGMTDEAIKAASGELGWWGTYIKFVEDGILGLRSFYVSQGLEYPYGLAIFTFVLGVKLITLPLNWKQLSGAARMKSIKPVQERVQLWYGDNDQMKNAAVGNLYENLDINPLAGCLPALAQIPVFLGVYYSVTSIAKAAIIQEGFLWIPNLSGPISDRRDGLTWLTDGWVDGVPRLGWEDTLAYLTIPVILVATQTLSLQLLGSFDAIDDGKEESKNVATALRLLPLMIGWFAMNAPSGLGLYWVFNNVLTTVSTVTVKKLVEQDELEPEPIITLAALGPRRDPLPMAEMGGAPDWVPQAPKELEEGANDGEASEAKETADVKA
jgi:YidC/Oxa1 family membrane protein insertase